MLDGSVRTLIDRPLNMLGRSLARLGVTADGLTLAGFAFGMASAGAITLGAYLTALGLLLFGRLLDGLDGAVARATAPTDRGGFLDITLDFFFYGAVPLAFAARDPWYNALPAAFLLASFYANGSAFLAYAIMAAKRGKETTQQGMKSLYYMTGLAEGTETIAAFVICCVFPAWFPVVAVVFGCVCFVSAAARVMIGWRSLIL
jgi:phosphatidylglycerophosphate synthase